MYIYIKSHKQCYRWGQRESEKNIEQQNRVKRREAEYITFNCKQSNVTQLAFFRLQKKSIEVYTVQSCCCCCCCCCCRCCCTSMPEMRADLISHSRQSLSLRSRATVLQACLNSRACFLMAPSKTRSSDSVQCFFSVPFVCSVLNLPQQQPRER